MPGSESALWSLHSYPPSYSSSSVSSPALQQSTCLQGPVFPFFFHFLWTPQILLEDPAFLPSVDPISSICPSPPFCPIPIPMNQLPKHRNKVYSRPSCPQLARTWKHSLQDKSQPLHAPKIQRGQQKPRNGIPNKDKTVYQNLKL